MTFKKFKGDDLNKLPSFDKITKDFATFPFQ